jgi:tetratricopeptide (TPR) repeat protein
MSDVVVQGLASNAFWLIVLLVVVGVFRNELKNLVNSLGSFKVAGASFEMKDSRASIEYYVVLTNILVEILLQRDAAKTFGGLVSDTSIRQLARFAIKYSKEVPDDVKQVELLKNVAMIVGRRGSVHEAVAFFDALLKDSPHDLDLLNLKATSLADTGSPENHAAAEMIYDRLVSERPSNGVYRFNRALTKVALGKDQQAINDLDRSIDAGYWNRRKDMLDVPEFARLRSEVPEFEGLRQKLRRCIESAGNP